YRGPAERDYRERLRLRRGDTVASQAFPELELPVVEILGAE
ncbi:MAG: Uma2 family endonuclease, partial [Bosea sp.]|nr:Uma2 family endonuclease [Bosea sp. (in: a-proteobacteria)]